MNNQYYQYLDYSNRQKKTHLTNQLILLSYRVLTSILVAESVFNSISTSVESDREAGGDAGMGEMKMQYHTRDLELEQGLLKNIQLFIIEYFNTCMICWNMLQITQVKKNARSKYSYQAFTLQLRLNTYFGHHHADPCYHLVQSLLSIQHGD